LLFSNPVEEAQFTERYVSDQRKEHQAALILGAFLFYVFFLWDHIIDPDVYQLTQAIRGMILAPTFLVSALVLQFNRKTKYAETIIVLPTILGNIGLTMIFCILKNGMNYGSVGIVLVTLGIFTTVRVRFVYLLMYSTITVIAFNSGQFYIHTPGGVAGTNILSIVTAQVLGLFAAFNRETDWRALFLLRDELRRAKSPFKARITISYRRQDSAAITGRIFDHLAAYFGYDSIFMDIDAIPLGVDFRSYINSALQTTDFVLVIIGPHWLGLREDGMFRINDENDPVRVELEAAMQAGLTMIPILVDSATMPLDSDLPESLRSLVFINAAEVASGRDFHTHIDRLISFLNGAAGKLDRAQAIKR